MKEALKDLKYAKMELVDIVYGDDQSEKSTTVDGKEGLLRVETISDVLLIHPYLFDHKYKNLIKEWIKLLDDYDSVKNKTRKPMLVTECCWGSLDDNWRVENIRMHFTEFSKRKLGWIACALNHGLAADRHRPEYGPVGEPGNLAFIEADGTLRKGHEVFNEF